VGELESGPRTVSADLPPRTTSGPPPRASWLARAPWRFTIRELLLLTAAVGAFLAWANLYYRREKPFRETPIPRQLSDKKVILAICNGVAAPSPSYTGAGDGSSGTEGCEYVRDVRIEMPRQLRGAFMNAYRNHVWRIINEHADQSWGAGTHSDGRGLYGFHYRYSKGDVRGSVFVRCHDGAENITLFVFIQEHKSTF
jgi:hypothetical protein